MYKEWDIPEVSLFYSIYLLLTKKNDKTSQRLKAEINN